MRVLTVRQPWAWAIVHGGKDVENRTRNIAGDYRGPVAIHAGLSYDSVAHVDPMLSVMRERARLNERPWVRHHGHILGVVDIVGIHQALRCFFTVEDGARTCSPWAEQDAWHLELANSRPLAEPIPFRGALGMRTLDPGIEARVREGLQ